MSNSLTQDEKIKRGAEDSGRYFRYMMDFVGFTSAEAQAIKESGLVIEKYIPSIVADFYAHLLRYPPTRKHFLKKDGTVDQDYLQKRMHHLSNFWRRTASGEYDDEYARYVDYVGRAHTSHGADPNIYIAERYVIGQVGFMQRAISEALTLELREYDPDLEKRAVRAWNMLMMVILEMLARAYEGEHEAEAAGEMLNVNEQSMRELAIQTYEIGLGLGRPPALQQVKVAAASAIPEGERKLVEINGISIGVFHHKGQWYALRNHCLHRGGPVCTGRLEGDTLTCPWHGYQYDVTTGRLLMDQTVQLEHYALKIEGDDIYLTVPEPAQPFSGEFFMPAEPPPAEPMAPKENEFRVGELPPGGILLVKVDGQDVAVYNVAGTFYATSAVCTHEGGPLDEGELTGTTIECPWHGSCFDVTSGAVKCGPADQPVRTYKVTAENGTGRVEP